MATAPTGDNACLSKKIATNAHVSSKKILVKSRNATEFLQDLNIYILDMKQDNIESEKANEIIYRDINNFIHKNHNNKIQKPNSKIVIFIISGVCESEIYEDKLHMRTFRKIADLLDRLHALNDETNAAIGIMERLVKLDLYSGPCLESLRVY